MVSLLEDLTLFLLKLGSQAATFTVECLRGGSSSCCEPLLCNQLEFGDAVPHELVLSLECLVFPSHQPLEVWVGPCQVALVIQSLVQAADGILLRLNLAAIVLNHCVAFVLKSLILSLGLDELPLELLHLFSVWSSSCERLREISAYWVASVARLERRAKR